MVIPESVTYIGIKAFCGCSGFKGNLVIPQNVTSVEYGAFQDCSGFTGRLVIPEDITVINNDVFSGCSGLSGELRIPGKVRSIGSKAFYRCSNLTGNLEIPSSVENIGYGAFEGCSSLSGNLIISERITSINDYVFRGCSGLTGDLIIPQGVTSIGAEAFKVCYGLNGKLTIPNSVTSIGREVFSGCRFTGDLLLPESVASVGSVLFSGCCFDSIIIGMRSIPGSMLGSINSDIKLLDSVESIEESAFSGSDIKGEIIIPDSVKTIGAKAFYNCQCLKKVTISAGVEEVGADAFGHVEYGSGKKAITILGKTTKLNSNALGNDCLIYGYSGSTAEAYAENYPGSFISLETTPNIAKYRVTTSQELKDAIGSFRHIVLADGIYEFPSMVILNGINHLTIEAENPGKVEILSSDFEETVIHMERCGKVAIKGCILGHGKPALNAGNDEVAISRCGPSAFVFYISDSFDIDIESCDLFGCGSHGIVSDYCADINVDKCVIRDCTTRITWATHTDNLVFADCVMSGCGSYYQGGGDVACRVENADVSMKNCLIFNNGCKQFDDTYWGDEVTTVDCIFCNNAWDGETPGIYGICLNGITWQMDGDTLKIGYPLQLRTDKVVQSEKGSVLPYSDSSLPWKNCSYQQIDVAAEGVSGNVSSFGGENEEVLLQVVDGSGTIIAETQVVGGKASYKLENVPAGSYTLRAAKKNHVSRDYSVTVTADRAMVQNIELWLTGDVNGDGKVNAKDKKILYNHIAGNSPMADYTFLVGDVNKDGRINAKDKKMVYNHIAGNALLWN